MNKTTATLVRAVSLSLGLIALPILADNIYEDAYGQFNNGSEYWNNGSIDNVPSGASVEWEVYGNDGGFAQIILGGGGLDINQTAAGGEDYDNVVETSYDDTLSYELDAVPESGSANALFDVDW